MFLKCQKNYLNLKEEGVKAFYLIEQQLIVSGMDMDSALLKLLCNHVYISNYCYATFI